MMGFGGMLSFELGSTRTETPGLKETEQFMRHLRLITPALSLGGVENADLLTGPHFSHQTLTRRACPCRSK